MNIDDYLDSKYMTPADLDGKAYTLEITKVEWVEVWSKSDQEKQRVPLMSFAKARKGLLLNKTNGKILRDAYGKQTEDWIGHRVRVYTARVKAFGKMVDAIRIDPITVSEEPLEDPGENPGNPFEDDGDDGYIEEDDDPQY